MRSEKLVIISFENPIIYSLGRFPKFAKDYWHRSLSGQPLVHSHQIIGTARIWPTPGDNYINKPKFKIRYIARQA